MWALAAGAEQYQQRIDGLEQYGLVREVNREIDGKWCPPGFPVPLVGFTPVAKGCLRVRIKEAAARLSLACTAHRLSTGQWPHSPSDLAAAFPGGVPADPISGLPFRFTLAGDGSLTLISPGAAADDPDKSGVWRLPAPGRD